MVRSAVCGLLALAQLIAFSHVALVAHRICSEHGEAIHGNPLDDTAVFSGRDDESASFLPAGGDVAGHDHEHCLCMAHSRERLVFPSPTSAGPAYFATVQLRQVLDPPAHAVPVPLLFLAPKGSPPVSL